ncbi:hypothetical protein K9M74_03450 [Candidatus Woesearchaeota archaeon]|nr:hypothetical protein [Candidatus Woesearchaeota archaeon]
MDDPKIKQVSSLFKQRLEQELAGKSELTEDEVITSRAYEEFKKQYMPKHLSFYEKICRLAEKTMPMKPDEKKIPRLQQAIDICHLNTTPTGVYSLSLFIPLLIILLSAIIFYLIPAALGGTGNMFFVIFALFAGLLVMIPLQKLPFMLSNSWRMKASNQMVLAIFYIVTYMRHTSNLELAINFAAEHLAPPLSLDMRKIIWDVETEKYDELKESLNAYLETWQNYNREFVESVHLIQSSLYEASNDRRLGSLDKALSVMLDETYEKMLHYAHGLKTPLTTLNMMGVVLPILTLVILPLVVSFMGEFRWYHLFAIYNIALPAIVFYLGKNILSTRPGGSGDEDITIKHPELKKYKNVVIKFGKQETFIKPIIFAALVFIFFLFIGLLPLIWNAATLPDYGIVDNGDGRDFRFGMVDSYNPEQVVKYQFLGYRDELDADDLPTGKLIGPFGLGALLLSICIPLGVGLAVGLYYRLKSGNVIKIRKQAKALEIEFSSALFQLGSRLGDGIPAETAFGKIAVSMEGTISGKFFALVNANITRLGMSVHQAIFDHEKGALNYYPSDIIESSMKVLVESSRKGPQVASQAIINVSEYIKQMHRVDERLKDLMGDVISSMKSQALFLTPVISAVVVGITSLITSIMGTLGDSVGKIAASADGMAGTSLLAMFGSGIPTYYFQIVVGLYVVMLAYILTIIGNGIENGPDKIGEQYALGQNMLRATIIYSLLVLVVIILFNIVSGQIMNQMVMTT